VHKYYEAHKHTFKCPNCRDTFSTKQVMQVHGDTCSAFTKGAAMLRRFRERPQSPERGPQENGGNGSEEEKRSSSDSDSDDQQTQGQTEQDDGCRECDKPIFKEDTDWWCDGCGYGLCEGCRPTSALSHVYACPKRKNAPSKRTKKNM
jgi:predicted RNA-binding Zn-ribbon protein involved in translation (DUF1610 family)